MPSIQHRLDQARLVSMAERGAYRFHAVEDRLMDNSGLRSTAFRVGRRAAMGRRLLLLASLASIAVAILHTVGNLNTAPVDAAQASLQQAMQAYHFSLGMGMTPSAWDILRSLTFTMSVCLAGIGLVGIVLTGDPDVSLQTMHRISVMLTAVFAGLTAIYAVFRIPPPLVTLGFVMLLYLICAVMTRAPAAD